jgi:hypothetical protein
MGQQCIRSLSNAENELNLTAGGVIGVAGFRQMARIYKLYIEERAPCYGCLPDPGQCTTLLPPLCGARAPVRPPCSPRFLPALKTFKTRRHADSSFNSPRILRRCSLLVLGVFSARLQPPALSSKWVFLCAHLSVLSSPSLFRGTLFARFSVPFLRCVSVLARVGVLRSLVFYLRKLRHPKKRCGGFRVRFQFLFSLLRYQKEREIVRQISVRTGGSE